MNSQAVESNHYSSKNDREIVDAKVIVTSGARAGRLRRGDMPGHGVGIDEKLAAW